jgi:hypothetical protein
LYYKSSVEDEWLIAARDGAPSHDGGFYVVYVSDQLLVYGKPGGATRGKWGIRDGKVESGLMLDSELQGGSPRLCRLRTDRLALVNKIKLCTNAYRI